MGETLASLSCNVSIRRKKTTTFVRAVRAALVLAFAAGLGAGRAHAQDGKETDPTAALQAVLAAACRQDETSFTHYLTKSNEAAFAKLSDEQRLSVIKHFALLDRPGHPLLSGGAGKPTVLRCEGTAGSVEFRLGDARVEEAVAFIPVDVSGQRTQFGLIHEAEGWRLLSLGLLLFDVPQLVDQWAQQDIAAREDAAARTLLALADAIRAYQQSFGQLPESLEQLGPSPPEGASPDHADLIGGDLAAGSRNNYQYRYQIVTPADGGAPQFELSAVTEKYGDKGKRSLLLDEKGRMHAADKNGKAADVSDPVITVASSDSR